MRLMPFLVVFFVLLIGCALESEPQERGVEQVQELLLTSQELGQLGLSTAIDESNRTFFALNETNCRVEKGYGSEENSQGEYAVCVYMLNDTRIVIELQKFTTYENLNGSYQYQSSHLFGSSGIISQDTYGDQSKFHVNSEDDYGAEFNEEGVYYFHLWITKDLYLIHITSGGEDIRDAITDIADTIMNKF